MKIIKSSNKETAEVQVRGAWKILVVDDEPDVHTLTRLTLRDASFAGRRMEILEAHSATEAKVVLQAHADIAVALVDVVMESEDAGLKLVEWVRTELGNALIRIVIRTGQPGIAPERFVIDNYDIDDYKDKTELTAMRLYTTMRTAIKAYRDLRSIDINRRGLERVLSSAPEMYRLRNKVSLEEFFRGVLTQVIGLCHLSHSSYIATMSGVIATVDDVAPGARAAAGKFLDSQRFREIDDECRNAVFNGQAPRRLREAGFVVPLAVDDRLMGYLYVEPTDRLEGADKDMVMLMAQQCAQALENLRLHVDLEEAYDGVIETLARSEEFKDKTTGGHINRIQHYVRDLALELGIEESAAIDLGKASRLHDVGKVGVPDRILCKPGRLEGGEIDIMRDHAQIGARILDQQKSLRLAREIAVCHHERWDGTGYPQGLAGEAIPLAARIVAVADVFDALVGFRPYKLPWPRHEARAAIAEGAGSQFDPKIVSAFLRILDRGGFDELIAEAGIRPDGIDLAPAAAN